MTVAVVVPAAGSSLRMGRDKLWIEAAGLPVLGHTLCAIAGAGGFDRIVVATEAASWPRVRALARAAGIDEGALRLVEGGARRQDSVAAALPECGDAEVIVVHDAARPLASADLFGAVVEAARRVGAATVATPLVDTVKRVDASELVLETLDRSQLRAVQTPQGFRAELLRRAHAEAARSGLSVDDDCALVEALGEPVVTVPGHPLNLKITRPADLDVLEAALAEAGR